MFLFIFRYFCVVTGIEKAMLCGHKLRSQSYRSYVLDKLRE